MDRKCYLDKIRNQVRLDVEEMFKHPKDGTEFQIGNIRLKFVLTDKKNDPLNYVIEVYEYGRYLESFRVFWYAWTYWELISKPWIHDYTNDIAYLVMDNIDIDELVKLMGQDDIDNNKLMEILGIDDDYTKENQQ